MRIQSKGLNTNETYCCTKEDLKAFFANDDIDIYFGILNMSRNETLNSKKYRPNKKCADRILARMVVLKRGINKFGLNYNSYLSLFIMNKEGYTDELKLKFVSEVLPKLKQLYEIHKDDDPRINHGAFTVTVGLKNQCFNFYEDKEARSI